MRFLRLSIALAGSLALAQTAFDAASIRPTPPERPPFPYMLGPASFSMRGLLVHFVVNAYEVETYQVADIPAWAQETMFDIQAKPVSEANPHQIRMMLQDLLAGRFQLKLHHETRIMSGYVLSVEKNGAKLPPAKTDVPPESNGSVQIGGGQFWGRGANMKILARVLTIELETPVVDRTAILGNYDFRLKFDEANEDLKMKPSDGAAVEAAPVGSVYSALHEFGLRLDAQKVPIDVLVVDSVERPSAN